jgi:hypothetical protein
VAFVGGALGIVGTLAMIWAFRREGPIWLTLFGYALAAGGGAAAFIAAIPWLWRLAA